MPFGSCLSDLGWWNFIPDYVWLIWRVNKHHKHRPPVCTRGFSYPRDMEWIQRLLGRYSITTYFFHFEAAAHTEFVWPIINHLVIKSVIISFYRDSFGLSWGSLFWSGPVAVDSQEIKLYSAWCFTIYLLAQLPHVVLTEIVRQEMGASASAERVKHGNETKDITMCFDLKSIISSSSFQQHKFTPLRLSDSLCCHFPWNAC